MAFKITVLCHETPFPPTHGGKVDMWRRLLALKRAGNHLQIISWDYGALDAGRAKVMDHVADDHLYIPLKRTLAFRAQHLLRFFRHPWFACIRWPGSELGNIARAVKEFAPDIIFLDGWHGALVAFYLQDKLGLPLYYRSQNIEHQYIRAQHRYATTFRARMVTYIAGLHMQKFEHEIISRSAIVFDISVDDIKYWNGLGYANIQYLPPIFGEDSNAATSEKNAVFDLVFLGNLRTPNNIAGVTWLIEKVMPIIWRSRPNTTLLLAGSNPDSEFGRYLEGIVNIKVLLNPGDAGKVLVQGRICVNPISTAGGVQIKNIDMLLAGRPIVTRSSGVSGLPSDVRKCFFIADEESQFSDTILKLLCNPQQTCDKQLLHSYFGELRIKELIDSIASNLENKPQSL